MNIRWQIRAASSFVEIYDYYYNLNPTYAKRFYEKVIEGIEILTKFPQCAPVEQVLTKTKKRIQGFINS